MVQKRLVLFITAWILGLWSPLIWGAEITYGAEFEFTNDWVNQVHTKGYLRGNEGRAAGMLAEVIKLKCRSLGCQVTAHSGKWTKEDRYKSPEFRVLFPQGFWMNISYDPLCIEVQSKPMTQKEWKRFAPLIQQAIFDSATDLGFETRDNRAGHFNIGVLSAFESNNNVKDFLRFFVDYANHAELASGVLRKNWSTAVPMILQSEEGKKSLQELIVKVESGQIRRIDEAAAFIQEKVYRTHPEPSRYLAARNQALSVENITALSENYEGRPALDKALEIRAVRAQKSVYEFIQLIEVFESRIGYLKGQTSPMALNLPSVEQLTAKESVSRFESYLTESGLKSQNYLNLLPKDWVEFSSANLCRRLF